MLSPGDDCPEDEKLQGPCGASTVNAEFFNGLNRGRNEPVLNPIPSPRAGRRLDPDYIFLDEVEDQKDSARRQCFIGHLRDRLKEPYLLVRRPSRHYARTDDIWKQNMLVETTLGIKDTDINKLKI